MRHVYVTTQDAESEVFDSLSSSTIESAGTVTWSK